ncbi:hypothetical protein EVAR_89103_1 [Eumeta japonica]|uniref:Mariner Mos1 transposase n=1 Tax=Eumeta variegata TaxID=151549 RepID=A0A4C1XEX6_EUMVA|nr:hypothetical protein EVAR_89103_1 [Eumeta japonica]
MRISMPVGPIDTRKFQANAAVGGFEAAVFFPRARRLNRPGDDDTKFQVTCTGMETLQESNYLMMKRKVNATALVPTARPRCCSQGGPQHSPGHQFTWLEAFQLRDDQFAIVAGKPSTWRDVPLEYRKMVNLEWVTTTSLPEVCEEIRKNNRQRRIILHQDNASGHTSAETIRKIKRSS